MTSKQTQLNSFPVFPIPILFIYRFPFQSPDLLRDWIAFVERGPAWQPSRWSRICSRHFLPTDFKENVFRKCLKRSAIPTVKKINFSFPPTTLAQFPQYDTISNDDTIVIDEDLPVSAALQLYQLQDSYSATTGMNITNNIDTISNSNAEAPYKIYEIICRLCAQIISDTNSTQQNIDDTGIMSIFTKCFPTITLELSDSFPNKICNDCLVNLRQFAVFVERVQTVQCEFNTNANHSAQDIIQESGGYNSGAEQIADKTTKTIVIKQEPIVNVKQEVIDFSRSAIVNNSLAATTMLNFTRNQETLPQNDAYCEFCDAYFLNNFELKSHIVKYHSNGCRENAAKTANNCEIMEIITLDNVMMIDLVGNKSTGAGCTDTIANAEQMFDSPLSPIAMPYPATILKVETLNEFEQREHFVRSLLVEHSYSRSTNEPNVGLKPIVKFLKQEDGIQLQQNIVPVQSMTPAFEVFESNISVEPTTIEQQLFETIEIDSQPLNGGAKCCPLCLHQCRDMYQYLVHKKIYHSREIFKRKSSHRFSAICQDCSALFLTKLAFTNHRNYMCPVRRGITYQCPFCRLNFVKWLEMRQHSKQCLVGQAISTLKSIGVQCDVPDALATNTKKCRYACEQCGRSYGRKTNLVCCGILCFSC